jgi:dolichol-phosphate mannosyltransferase
MSLAIISANSHSTAEERTPGSLEGFPDQVLHPVLVVLPTYNEAEGIRIILDQLLASPVHPEILVVDDSSPDGTAAIVEEIASAHPRRVHLLVRTDKDGLGAAYRAGFTWAFKRDYRVICQIDADGSHPVDRLPVMIGALESGADVAIGSRYVDGGGVENWPAHRRGLSRFGNWYARTLLDLPQHDCTGSYRAWRTDALRIADPCSLTTGGYGFGVELVLTAHRRGLTFAEVPITFVDRVLGESKMTTGIALEAMKMVFRLRNEK